MSTGLHAGRQVALSFLILRLVVQPVVLVKGFFPNALFTVSVSFAAVHDIFESLFILSPCTLILPIKKNLLFLLVFSQKYMVCLPFGVKKLQLVMVLGVKVEWLIRLLRRHRILESDTCASYVLHSMCLIVPCQREIQMQ